MDASPERPGCGATDRIKGNAARMIVCFRKKPDNEALAEMIGTGISQDDSNPESVTIRTTLRPGDLGMVVYLHGILHGKDEGFDATFEAYVAGPLAEFVHRASPRERLWIAEHNGRVVGCIAIVAASDDVAQLRWFLLDPSVRGMGLGKRLLNEAVAFTQTCGYRKVILWTVRTLVVAAHLYRAAGFHMVEEKPGHMWGVDVIEEKYEMDLP
jgi:GNAT superfamily N-acetyltransferase